MDFLKRATAIKLLADALCLTDIATVLDTPVETIKKDIATLEDQGEVLVPPKKTSFRAALPIKIRSLPREQRDRFNEVIGLTRIMKTVELLYSFGGQVTRPCDANKDPVSTFLKELLGPGTGADAVLRMLFRQIYDGTLMDESADAVIARLQQEAVEYFRSHATFGNPNHDDALISAQIKHVLGNAHTAPYSGLDAKACERLIDVVLSYYGLDGRDKETLKEIGGRHGISGGRVAHLREQAFRRLRETHRWWFGNLQDGVDLNEAHTGVQLAELKELQRRATAYFSNHPRIALVDPMKWPDVTTIDPKELEIQEEILLKLAHGNTSMRGVKKTDLPKEAVLYEASLVEVMCRRVEEIELSVRSNNCLQNSGLTHLALVIECTEDDLLKIKNFGHKCLKEIKEILCEVEDEAKLPRGTLRPGQRRKDNPNVLQALTRIGRLD